MADDDDLDHDGFALANDCDDTAPQFHLEQAWYLDSDGDGYPDSLGATVACAGPAGSYLPAELTALTTDLCPATPAGAAVDGNGCTSAQGAVDSNSDGIPDYWAAQYGLSTTDGIADLDSDSDGWNNRKEFQFATDPTLATSYPPPQVLESIPFNGAGEGDGKRVPTNTSFAILVTDDGGIDLTNPTSIRFTIDDGSQQPYQRDLGQLAITKLNNDPDTAATRLWVAYHRPQELVFGDYPLASPVRVDVAVTERRALETTQQGFTFQTESSGQQQEALAGSPPMAPVPADDPVMDGYDAGIEATGGEIQSAQIIFNSDDPVVPTFGPIDEVPALGVSDTDAIGAPLNLQPPTVFTNPVKLIIPCPGYTEVRYLVLYLYDGRQWIKACDAAGNVLPDAKDWMVPGSRVNRNNSSGESSIEIKVYHFTGVQAAQEPLAGDINGDHLIDSRDIAIIKVNRNKPASAYPACDIDGDGKITVQDASKLVKQCTYPLCAIH